MKVSRYYQVVEDNFLWEAGAILKHDRSLGSSGGYMPISDIWNTTDHRHDEFISTEIIEQNPEYFTRVYEVDIFGKAKYLTKEKAKEAAKAMFGK